MKLRKYQSNCIKAVYSWLTHKNDNPLCVLATATGKSIIIGQFIKEVIEQYPNQRIVCCIDTRELVEQNYLKLLDLWTFAPAGIYSAGLKRKDTSSQILFAGIQSAYNKAFKIGKTDLLIIDECHMLSMKTESMWQQFIADMKIMNPDLRIVGFTATPYRLDSGLQHTGEDAMFGGIAYEYGIKQAIADGYITEITAKGMKNKLDVTGVGKRGGDFIESELQKAVNTDKKTKAIVSEILEYGKNRNAGLIFSSGVEHAYAIKDEIISRGEVCEVVVGDTPSAQRTQIIKSFKDKKIKYLVNNAVLTKGFDAPHVDLLAAVRPTQSPVLWTQMIGRGLRLADPSIGNLETAEERREAIARSSKPDCLLLDFAQNIHRFGYIDEMVFKDKKKRGEDDPGVPPMKECPECSNILLISVMVCPCGYEFPPSESDIDEKAYEGAVLSTQAEIVVNDVVVKEVRLVRHEKSGGTPSLRIDYIVSYLEKYSEWICLEHKGFARQKAESWWKNNTSIEKASPYDIEVYDRGVPKTINDALILKDVIKHPTAIKVKQDGKYWRVIGRSFQELTEPEKSHLQGNQLEQDSCDSHQDHPEIDESLLAL